MRNIKIVYIVIIILLLAILMDSVHGLTATGGVITDYNGYRHHTFTSSGTFTVTSGSGNIEVLIVAGGGGGGTGGSASRGGGGAGGLIHNSSLAVSAQAYSVVVGSGGTVGGGDGGNSSFDTWVAKGGGGGGPSHLSAGRPGGSGGGGSGWSDAVGGTGQQPGLASGGYGNDGGESRTGTSNGASGGGGGAGAVGVKGTSVTGGAGGVGLQYSQFAIVGGSPAGWFAGGGGGGGSTGVTSAGAGGTGGGGAGGRGTTGTAGTANTGGGGGGATSTGGAGGSGIVIVRYPVGDTCSVVHSGDFNSSTGAIITPFYSVTMDDGVVKNFIYTYLNSTYDWKRDDSNNAGSAFGEIFGGGNWRLALTISGTTCLVSQTTCDYVSVNCQNANGAKNNWTFHESYIELDSTHTSNYRVYSYVELPSPSTTSTSYNGTTTIQSSTNVPASTGTSGMNNPGMPQVFAWTWDESLKALYDTGQNTGSTWHYIAIGRSSEIAANSWMKQYFKILDVDGKTVNTELNNFKDDLLYGDPTFDSCVNITITNPSGAALTDFPVPLNVSHRTDMDSNFSDLRFYAGSCSSPTDKLFVEKEYIVESTNAYLWLKTNLTSTTTTVAMFYNNSEAVANWDLYGNVWTDNYLAVYHFSEDTGDTLNDFTSNENDGTPINNPETNTDAYHGRALRFDGNNQAFNLSDMELWGTNSFTIEVVWQPLFSGNVYLLGKYQDSSNRWYIRKRDDSTSDTIQSYAVFSGSSVDGRSGTDYIFHDTYYHKALVHERTSSSGTSYFKPYINSLLNQSATQFYTHSNASDYNSISADLFIGLYDTFYGWMIVDELRLINGTVSEEYINASYNLITSGTSYINYSDIVPSDSCACPNDAGTSWEVDMSDYCVLETSCVADVISFTGTGNFTIGSSVLLNVSSVGNLAANSQYYLSTSSRWWIR